MEWVSREDISRRSFGLRTISSSCVIFRVGSLGPKKTNEAAPKNFLKSYSQIEGITIVERLNQLGEGCTILS